jgi:hypothetical protein
MRLGRPAGDKILDSPRSDFFKILKLFSYLKIQNVLLAGITCKLNKKMMNIAYSNILG